MSGVDVGSKKPPYKRTDFRYEIWLKERKALRAKAKRESFKIEAQRNANLPGKARDVVCVDTTKARSTLDVIRICLRELGWREYPFGKRDGEPCDIYWHSVHFNENQDVPGGKVNKFPGMIEVVRKVNLGRSLDIMHQLFPNEYDFHPRSWFLPQQFAEFCDAARRANDAAAATTPVQRPVYIVKPDEGSQGDGIYLIQDPREYIFGDKSHVVQEYLARPLLLENLKFDFRVYVIVASLEPLEIYICKEGLARFCTVPYQPPTNKNITDAFMHLTNYSLNKRSSTYLHTESDDDGSKRTMKRVFRRLALMRYDTTWIWENIKRMVTKTIIAIMPELKVEMRSEVPPSKQGPSCFQILGFDIILTEDGRPFLLEVNANPSLRIDYENEIAPGIAEYIFSPVDEEIKKPLVMDTLLLMAPRHKSSARYLRRNAVKSPDKPLANSGTNSTENKENRENTKPESGTKSGTAETEEEEYEVLPPHRGYGSLEQTYPARYGDDFQELRMLERTADIFLECLGIRGHLRMGPTGFRNFTRKCKITGTGPGGFTNAAFDIMFIDLQRRWEHMNHDRAVGGLCYQGFVEAFFHIAKKKYSSHSPSQAASKLLDYCERNLEAERDSERRPKEPPLLPKIFPHEKKEVQRELREEAMKKAYGNPTRKKIVGNSYFIDYQKSPVTRSSRVGSSKGGCMSAPPRKKEEQVSVGGKQVKSSVKIGTGDTQ